MEPVQEAPRTVTLADSRVEQPSVSRDYLAPSETTAKPGESEALDVLAHVLGSGENCRLYRTLVVDKGIALSAGAYYSGTALDYAKFGVYGSPKPGVSLHEVEEGIDAVLADVVEHGVTADELDRAKNRLIADAVYAAGQSGDAGALVRRGARHRTDRRHGPHLARPHPRRDRRCRATSRSHTGSTAASR